MKVTNADKQKIKKAQVAVKNMRGEFLRAEKKAMLHIKKNPEKALLLAAGIGAAIGAATVYVLSRKEQ